MKRKFVWILLTLIILAGAGFYFRDSITGLLDRQSQAQAQTRGGSAEAEAADRTTKIRPATDIAQVSAAGNIALVNEQPAVLQVEGLVVEVTAEVGDEVEGGDVLVTLDTDDLERAIHRAELEIATRQTQLDKLLEPAQPADIAAARAKLISAQEELAEIKAGPSPIELAAAEIALTAAQERYQELVAGPSEAEITQLSAEMHKAFIVLQQAQGAYNEIAYRGDIGGTSQAKALQDATIDYDTVKAAFEIATESTSAADLQEALKSIRDAQYNLETLRQQPTAAEIAAAQATVAGAEAELAQLLEGPSEAELREIELSLEQAQLDLDEAQIDLARGKLLAPAAGTILSREIEPGQQVSAGSVALTLADLSTLELTVNVAEVDISKVQIGQPAQIAIDAFPDQIFQGEVSRIAPASESDGGVVNYPVTIRLSDLNLAGVRPGMTAVATLFNDTTEIGWLVPTNAIREFEGETRVMVIRDDQRIPVEVTRGASQGEWTAVQSSGLQNGDEVVGSVATFLNEEGNRGPGGPFRPRN